MKSRMEENAMIDLFSYLCRLCLENCGEYNVPKIEDLQQDIDMYLGIKVCIVGVFCVARVARNDLICNVNHIKCN